jgi:cysteine-rich repeat protein
VCGNAITEPGEECDDGDDVAGDGCDRCMRETPERACTTLLDDVTMVADACLECMCERCDEEIVDCYATGSDEDQRTCGALAECRLQTWCVGLGCYDGGPCTREVQVAGQSASAMAAAKRLLNLPADTSDARLLLHESEEQVKLIGSPEQAIAVRKALEPKQEGG